MAGKFLLKIVSPQGVQVNEEVESVTAPGALGEFGVLVGHTPFLTTLRAGVVSYTVGAEKKSIRVPGGIAEVRAREAILLITQSVKMVF
ncbi:MAG: F0F1 ATP synthase subunit epsilon [Deltaproteobacteria bacterium]|nr:F0F1 ATP synthase subunit epsilon [Deltaproteobacteria bacterium]